MKYLDSLKIPFLFFNKPSEELILKDIEKFETALSSGQIKSNKNKNYAHNTKVDIRRSLKVYLRWRLGKEKADKLTDWLDTRDIAKTPDYLKEQQVEKLFKACKTSHERFLIAILFDSGARASEFHNIRFEDITFPDGKDNYPKLTLKEEYSKTKGRTISLYWKYSLDAVRDYLREKELEGIRAEDPVYEKTYDSVRMFLLRLGKRVLKRQIHPHLFRHSSATYYATKLNRQQLCYRYGWTFSSNMPDIYISRAGMQDNELDEKFSSTTIEELKSIIEKQQQQNQLIKEKQEQLEAELEERRKFDPVLNKILERINVIDTLVDKQILVEATCGA
jgi:integrase